MSQTEGPDRRPLLYTLVGLIILGIAAVLFWPDRGEKSPPSMVLTPESVRQASNLEATAGGGSDSTTHASTDIDTVEVAADRFPVKDAELPPETASKTQTPQTRAARPTGTTAPKTTSGASSSPSSGASTKRSTSTRPAPSSALATPTSSGRYLLYVGSYRDEANARAAADRLIAQAVRADVVGAGNVYRVRVGFFSTAEDAQAYGRSLKSRVGLDYWVSQR